MFMSLGTMFTNLGTMPGNLGNGFSSLVNTSIPGSRFRIVSDHRVMGNPGTVVFPCRGGCLPFYG